MIRAIIIDDEERVRSVLKTMVAKYCPEVTIVGSAESVESGEKLFLKEKPNLIFLDVEMPHGSGFDLLKKLSNEDFEVIFVTGYDQYALQAIKSHALDYLLKPIDIRELIQAVQKVKSAINQSRNAKRFTELLDDLGKKPKTENRKISIPNASGREFIPVEKIIRCAADGSCTWFFLEDNRKVLSTVNLGEYEKQLNAQPDDQNCFFRVHYAHLINTKFIESVNRRENYVKLKDDEKVYIAQRRKTPFFNLLKEMNLL